jgi:tryptophanyl-tRNA synthetase
MIILKNRIFNKKSFEYYLKVHLNSNITNKCFNNTSKLNLCNSNFSDNKKIDDKIKNTTSSTQDNDNSKIEDFIVTPFEVKGKVDYFKLVNQFGTELITQETLDLFNQVLKKSSCQVKKDKKNENYLEQLNLLHWLERGVFFTHRGFNSFLKSYLNGEKVFLYTGRGPSSNAMHLGHLVPFMFTAYLQKVFDCPVIIQIADEEKSIKLKNFEEIYYQGLNNCKEIISVGFDPSKTFIFSNRQYRLANNNFELLASEMKMHVSVKDLKKIFGYNDETCIAAYDWPFYQTCAAFSDSYLNMLYSEEELNSNNINNLNFKSISQVNLKKYNSNNRNNKNNNFKDQYKVLIPHAIDQDPYFRLARDICPKINQPKPNNVMCKFIPPLSGIAGKMSSSVNSLDSIFLDDSEKVIRKKIMSSFSGSKGSGSLEDHKIYGGDINSDISCKYLEIFEEDTDKYNSIISDFQSGKLSCSGIKEILSNKIISIITKINDRKNKLTDDEYNKFFDFNKKLI